MASLKFNRNVVFAGVIILIILGVAYVMLNRSFGLKEGFATSILYGAAGSLHGIHYNKFTKSLYISSYDRNTVYVYDTSSSNPNRTLTRSFSTSPIVNPIAITSDSSGNVFVNGWRATTTAKFSPNGQLLQQFTLSGTGYTWSMAIDDSNNIYYTANDTNIYILPSGSTTSRVFLSFSITAGLYYSTIYDSVSQSIILNGNGGVYQIPISSPSITTRIILNSSHFAGTGLVYGAAIDGARKLYLADAWRGILRVYNMNTWSYVTDIITSVPTYSVAIDDAGVLYAGLNPMYIFTDIGVVGANVDCQLDPNNPYILGTCTGTCGTGTQTRTPNVRAQPIGTGKACPTATTQSCTIPCPSQPSGTVAVAGTPKDAGSAYTVTVYQQSPPGPNNTVTFNGLLVSKSPSVIPAVKSTWSVTNKPNFTPIVNSYTPSGSFETATFTFQFAGSYDIEYKIEYINETAIVKLNVVIGGAKTCTASQAFDSASGQCLDIVLPPLPPNTIGPLDPGDVKCPPGQVKDCPIVYQDPKNPSVTTGTNPCSANQLYNFVTHKCVDKKAYCCKYASTDGKTVTNPSGAANDPVCNDILKTVPKLKTSGLPTPCTGKAGENACCQPRNASARQCAAYYEKAYSWESPLSCTGVTAPFTDYSDGVKYIDEELSNFATTINNDSTYEIMPVHERVKARDRYNVWN
jgi:TM2 domain-containing membrane protein YozV